MVKGRWVLALGGAAAAFACGPDASTVPFLRDDHCPVGGCVDASAQGDAATIAIPDEPLEDWDTTDEGPLSGIFAVQTIVSARVAVKIELRQLLRLRIVQHGTRIHEKSTLCAFKLPDVPGVATLSIPPPLQAVLQTKSTEDEGDYLSSAAGINARYTPPPWLVVAGAKLGDPANDPLPTMMDPTNAVDDDMDGHPGVTLLANVLTCTTDQQLYVALRTTGDLSATVITGDHIEGAANIHLDESVLGYSDSCLSVASNIFIEIDRGSPLRAERVGDAEDVDHNGNVSCPEIVANAPGLFGDYWAQ
jgi:hypothetical protein